MSFKTLKLVSTAALLAGSSVAVAVPFGSFDSRSMAMGGAGVAVGGADAAPLFNPALLSVTKKEDDFALIIPTVGARVSDPENLRDNVDNFQNGKYVEKLQASVDALNAAITLATNTPTPANIAAIAAPASSTSTNLNTVSTQLGTLSDKPITADVGLATVVAIPSKKFGAAFYANGTVTAGGVFQYKDASTISLLANQTGCLATAAAMPTTTPAEITAASNAITACGTNVNFNNTTLKSGIHVKGVQLSEFGFALSREFQIKEHNVAFGITPKIVKAKLFDTVVLVNDSNQSNISAEDSMAEYSFFNFDLGAAKNYDNGWRTGFVLKNVLPQTLDFKQAPTPGATPLATGETLSLKPQARLGVSHANSWSTVALDFDVTRNDPAGLEQATQYLALGGELNAWDWAQLRAGYRADMVNSNRNVASVGLGLAIFGVVHVDLAYAGNANEFGASAQLGVHF